MSIAKDILITLALVIAIVSTIVMLVYFLKWLRTIKKNSIEATDDDVAKEHKYCNVFLTCIIIMCTMSIIPISFSILYFFS